MAAERRNQELSAKLQALIDDYSAEAVAEELAKLDCELFDKEVDDFIYDHAQDVGQENYGH